MTDTRADALLGTHDGPRPDTDMSTPSDIPDEWGMQSFPASDPPQNW